MNNDSLAYSENGEVIRITIAVMAQYNSSVDDNIRFCLFKYLMNTEIQSEL